MRGQAQFVGSAGQYHVAYCLTVRGIHAAITLGNVPDVDVGASNHDGSRLLAIQVKTHRWAHRQRRYGYEVREWQVGNSAAGRWSKELWHAFVDLQERDGATWTPTVFIVPSLWVGNFVRPEWGRKLYMLRAELWPECQERWDRVHAYLEDDPNTLRWCNGIPVEARDWDDAGNPIFSNAARDHAPVPAFRGAAGAVSILFRSS